MDKEWKYKNCLTHHSKSCYGESSIQYRYGHRIEYVYDASGMKRTVTYKTSNKNMNYYPYDDRVPADGDFYPSPVTRQYMNNKVYENNKLKYILTEEGYLENVNNLWYRYFYLKDRLGNNRIVMDVTGKMYQANNYYPSGVSMAESPSRTDQGVQPYKFGDKELDRFMGLDFYDFVARPYDPTLMRFTRPDPSAEKNYSVSPYAYCGNNPVNVIDPMGRDTTYANRNGDIYATLTGGENIVIVSEPLPEVTVTAPKPKSDAAKVMEGAVAISATLGADDATGVGVADDPAIPFVLVAGTLIATDIYLQDKLTEPYPSSMTGQEEYNSPPPKIQQVDEFAHGKKAQSTGSLKGARGDSHDAQYTHGGKNRIENPNKRKGADERRNKGKRIN